jgi:tetratricopeptide (TPR) repeat protein
MLTKPNTGCVVSFAICLVACSHPAERTCAQCVESKDWPAAYHSCQGEFLKTNDPMRALDAAIAAHRLQRWQDALRLAAPALSNTATAADAQSLIGSVHFRLGDFTVATSQLEQAARVHKAAGNAYASARDQQQLSGVFYQLGDYQQALDAEAAARDLAGRAHDESIVAYLDLARADILRAIGDLHGAQLAGERALAGARDAGGKVHALIRQGILHIESGHPGLARDPLARGLEMELATPAPRKQLLEALHLNLAYVERKARAFDRALAEMEKAKQAGTDEMSYHLNRGLVLDDMGRLAEARADLDAAEAAQPSGEWSWWVPFQRARVAARQHDLAAAIDSDRRAIERVARLALKSGTFGPTVIANHREPHLHLVGLLAADQRWSDVLGVVAAMDGQSLLNSTEASADPAPGSVNDPSLPTRAAAGTLAPDATKLAIEAWRARHLTIVVPGGERIWRLDVVDGHASGCDIGDVRALGELARALEKDPADADAGRQLGQAMLPDAPAGTQIDLLVIGPLARAPLAALRLGDRPAIARYPLARVPGFLPRTVTGRATGAAISIGDPEGDLPNAAGEARKVAARLKGTALIGAEATRAAFARVAGARLLHVAAHTTRRSGGATLRLADGPVSLDDIAKLAPAPAVVVLASCGASAGRDDAGNGSLTGAFLDAGAEIVVGTRWSIDDGEAAQLVESFYAARGDRDPVRALVEVQLASKLPATTVAAFEAVVARPGR